MYFWEWVLLWGWGRRQPFTIKLSSIKMYNNNIINNPIVALCLVFFSNTSLEYYYFHVTVKQHCNRIDWSGEQGVS